ncbi:MAG: apolipoprotein N-acyltransferase [Verrucomicrobiales bacterium]|jgi:apolipoprotein N-acyltransferase
MNWRSPTLPWIAATLSGVLLALCFEPWNFGVLLWLWQIPLFATLWFCELPDEHEPPRIVNWMTGGRVRRFLFAPLNFLLTPATADRRWAFGFKVGLLSGFVFFVGSLWWIGAFVVTSDSTGFARFAQMFFGGAVVCVLSGYLACYFGIWGAFVATLGRLRKDKIAPQESEPELVPEPGRSEKLFSLTSKNRKESSIMTPSLHSLWIALICSSCWVGLEWLRGWVLGGFGWNGLGVALHDEPNLIQIADVVGVTGLSFLPVFCICIGVTTLARFRAELGKGRMRPHVDFGIAMLVLILTFFYGLNTGTRYAPNPEEQTELDLVLIQGAIPVEDRSFKPEKYRGIVEQYRRMTEMHAGSGSDLIVWPETALPYPFLHPGSARPVNDIMSRGDFSLALGSEDYESLGNPYDVYNGLFLVSKSGDLLRNSKSYRKHYLLPFGEYMPMRNFGIPGTDIKPIHWAVKNWLPHNFRAGEEFELLSMTRPEVDLIPSVCYEDTVGRHQRRFIADNEVKRPQLLLNITNDGWFKSTPVVRQHLANARFRAIELRRHMARCSNTGASCIIDPFGNLTEPEFLEVPFETLSNEAIFDLVKNARSQSAPVEFIIGHEVISSASEIVINTNLRDFKELEGVLLSGEGQRISVNSNLAQRDLFEETINWLPQVWPKLSISVQESISDISNLEEFYKLARRKWPEVPISFRTRIAHLKPGIRDFFPNTFPTTVMLDSNPPITVYAKFGDWFALTALLFTALIIGVPATQQLLARRKRKS